MQREMTYPLRSLRLLLHGQALPALRTTTIEDLATVLCGYTTAKAVCP